MSRLSRSAACPALLVLFLLSPSARAACVGAPGPDRVRLDTVVAPLRNASGEVAFTVYPDDRRRFLSKGGKLVRARVPARAPETAACFLLPPGSYAVAVYHDENGDHDFNRTLFVPKEGFAFSNDAPTAVGLPSLADARFRLNAGGGVVRMRMRYRR